MDTKVKLTIKTCLIIFLMLALLEIDLYGQYTDSKPIISLKASLNLETIYGKDNSDPEWSNSLFFQPGISMGFLVRDMVYIGAYHTQNFFSSSGSINKSDWKIMASEVGLRFKNGNIIGLIYGQQSYFSPSNGLMQLEVDYDSQLYGLYWDYELNNYISIPVRLTYSSDLDVYGSSHYWHFTIGISGNIPIIFNKRN